VSPTVIEREILIEAPQDVVWRIVTEPAQISQWFSDAAQIDLRPGGEGVLVFGDRATNEQANEPVTVQLVVESIEPPNRFSFRWAHPEGEKAHEGNTLRVDLTLIREGENTRLRLVESGFAQVEWSEQQKTQTFGEHDSGWDIHLGRLRDYASRRSEASASS
jgi:uncharacterized protein YndB with AHSA1/START domain